MLALLSATLLVATGGWAVATGRVPTIIAAAPWPHTPAGAAAAGTDHPAPGREAAGQPLGTPAAVLNPDDSYRFSMGGDGPSPLVGYDPCRPIHYVIRPHGAPAGAEPLIAEAIGRVSAATGLHFVPDGATTEAPSAGRRPYQPGVYGDRWAPVLIAWVGPAENPDVAGDVVGQAGSVAVSVDGGPRVYVTGQVELDGPQLAEILSGPAGPENVRAVIQHELAHLVGLDHVNDPTQLMHPEAGTAITDFGAGDRTGLSLLGRGPCEPDL